MANVKALACLLIFSFIHRDATYSKSIADPYTYFINADNIAWPSNSVRNVYATSNRYVARNLIPTRFQARGVHAVLAFPRLRPGVPITLGKIALLAHRRLPEIKPFPSWDMQEEGNPDAIQNAVDLYLDEKAVLWVLDTGQVSTLEAVEVTGRPRVLGLNFYTGKVVHEVDLSGFAMPCSRFQCVVAENGLGRPVVYVSCAAACSLVVYDVTRAKGRIVALPCAAGRGDAQYMVLVRPAKQEPLVVLSHLSSPALLAWPLAALRAGRLGQTIDLGEKTGEMVILGTDNGSKMFFRWKGDRQVRVWELAGGVAGDVGARGVAVGADDPLRTSTQVAGGSRLLTWSLESNFADFVEGTVGSVGASACLRPLVQCK